MGETTGIDWCDATWNPWFGCRRVSTGCRGCYAAREMKAYGMDWKVARSKTRFDLPLRLSEPCFIFACSWSDFFISDADGWRPEAWEVIRQTPQHTYLLLTKRPGRLAACLPRDWGQGWPNVWLGVSAENQRWADRRIPKLLEVPAVLRFASFEPMLEPLALRRWLDVVPPGKPRVFPLAHTAGLATPLIDWVIAGGESGPDARRCNPAWLSGLQRQCEAARVPFFCKQLGGHPNKRSGDDALLDGRLWKERPTR